VGEGERREGGREGGRRYLDVVYTTKEKVLTRLRKGRLHHCNSIRVEGCGLWVAVLGLGGRRANGLGVRESGLEVGRFGVGGVGDCM
jgi:hypothetical protein